MLVESRGALINGVHNHGSGGDPRGLNEGAVQGIHEKELADALPVMALVDGEAAQQRGRNQGVAREFLATSAGSSPMSIP